MVYHNLYSNPITIICISHIILYLFHFTYVHNFFLLPFAATAPAEGGSG